MSKILEEIEGRAKDLRSDVTVEMLEESLRINAKIPDLSRNEWCHVAAYAVRAVELKDAEAENAKYLEQARALLDLAFRMGHKYLHVSDVDTRMTQFEMCEYEARHRFALSAEPAEKSIEALAKVLRERAK